MNGSSTLSTTSPSRQSHRDHAVAGLQQLAPSQARTASTVCQESVLGQLVQAAEAAAGQAGWVGEGVWQCMGAR